MSHQISESAIYFFMILIFLLKFHSFQLFPRARDDGYCQTHSQNQHSLQRRMIFIQNIGLWCCKGRIYCQCMISFFKTHFVHSSRWYQLLLHFIKYKYGAESSVIHLQLLHCVKSSFLDTFTMIPPFNYSGTLSSSHILFKRVCSTQYS